MLIGGDGGTVKDIMASEVLQMKLTPKLVLDCKLAFYYDTKITAAHQHMAQVEQAAKEDKKQEIV